MPDIQTRFLAQIDQHRGILYKVARTYGRSPPDRDDLVQEAVAQLWRAFPRYNAELRFSTWMYRIALNVAISWQRREHGLQLVAGSARRLKRGTVYVTLGRMDDKGYITSRLDDAPPDAGGLPRRVYRPTALGRRVLRAWTTAIGHVMPEFAR